MNADDAAKKAQVAERAFLHDLSTPLMIAHGWLERWEARDPQIVNVDEFAKLKNQIDKIWRLLKSRRDQVSSAEVQKP